jgi:hypothetical protein
MKKDRTIRSGRDRKLQNILLIKIVNKQPEHIGAMVLFVRGLPKRTGAARIAHPLQVNQAHRYHFEIKVKQFKDRADG